jgi:hypothetical protein
MQGKGEMDQLIQIVKVRNYSLSLFPALVPSCGVIILLSRPCTALSILASVIVIVYDCAQVLGAPTEKIWPGFMVSSLMRSLSYRCVCSGLLRSFLVF